MHEALKGSWGIGKLERDHKEFIMSQLCFICRLVWIISLDSYFMVPATKVQISEDFVVMEFIQ